MARPSPQTDRVVALVDLLAAHPDRALTLAEITRRLGVHKSSCHAMLASLSRAGWLLRDPSRKTYRLGPALVAVGRTAASGYPALEFAQPVMVELSLALEVHCAALAVAGDTVTVLDQVTDPRAPGPGLRVGTAYPLRPPFGSAVLAWADDDAVAAWLALVPDAHRAHYRQALAATHDRGFAVEISSTPVARVRELLAHVGDDADATTPVHELLDQLAAELASREEYLAVDLQPDQEYRVNAVNAPVLDHHGGVALVLSLTGFTAARRGDELVTLGALLVGGTERLTAALGGRR